MASILAPLATDGWQLVTGTADGFDMKGNIFEALQKGECRITLWFVVNELWITAALRPGWEATRQLADRSDPLPLVTALMNDEIERTPIAPRKPSLFAGLFGRTAPEPVSGVRLRACGVVLEEWPVAPGGGVFTSVSPAWGTGS